MPQMHVLSKEILKYNIKSYLIFIFHSDHFMK